MTSTVERPGAHGLTLAATGALIFVTAAPLSGAWIGAAAAWIAILVLGLRGRLAKPQLIGWGTVMALLIIWAMLTGLWSTAPDAAAQKAVHLLALLTPWLALMMLAPPPPVARVRFVLVIAVLAGIVFLLVERAFDFPLFRLANSIAAEAPVEPWVHNRPAAVLALLACALALLSAEKLGWKAVAWPLLTLPVVLFGSESAASALGLALTVPAFLIVRIAPMMTRKLVPPLLALLVLATPLLARLPAAFGLVEADWLHRHFRHRAEIWDFAAERVAEKPLLGWGLEASRAMPSGGRISAIMPELPSLIPLHPHNAPLQIWLETGLPGALAAAFLLALGARAALTGTGEAPAWRFATLVCLLAIAATAFGLWQSWWIAIMGGTILTMAWTCRWSNSHRAPA